MTDDPHQQAPRPLKGTTQQSKLQASRNRAAALPDLDLTDGHLTTESMDSLIRQSIKGVSFQREYQRWKCTWHANGRQHQKYFSVKKLGFRRAKQEAIEWKLEMERDSNKAGRRNQDPRRLSTVKGVAFNSANRWYASWYHSGKQRHLYFSVDDYGFEVRVTLTAC